MPPELTTLVIAMLPIVELRGALPLAMSIFGFGFWKAYFLSVIGNIAPIIPLLIFLKNFSDWLMTHSFFFKKFFTWWFERTRRHSDIVEKYETLGLMLFVAVPLPMTGAWSGCVAAYLLGIKFKHAVMAISAGVIVAGFIVGVVTAGATKIF